MINREILPDEKGVVYRADSHQVLWAFQNFDFKLPANSSVLNVNTGEKVQTRLLQAVKYHVYHVKPSSR